MHRMLGEQKKKEEREHFYRGMEGSLLTTITHGLLGMAHLAMWGWEDGGE